MTWIDVYIKYKSNNSVCKCPNCGNKLSVDKTDTSITFSCDFCEAFRHFDEVSAVNEDQDEG